MTDELEPRKRDILLSIVEDYIARGEPIGSLHLARKAELDFSAATIRAVMADLEELGYLEKPHTSAGRVPTDAGYRFFVDSLVHIKQPALKDREIIEQAMPEHPTVEQALDQVSRLLHDLSHHASLVLGPKQQEDSFRHIEFVRLKEDRALAVLVSQSGMVQNKLVHLSEPLDQNQLAQAANYLNGLLQELTLEQARARVAKELEEDRARYDQLQRHALTLAQSTMLAPEPGDSKVLIQGQGSLLEGFSLDQAKAALRVLEEKTRLLSVLDHTRDARQLQIFIGAESGFRAQGLSLVATPFGEGEVLGTLGIIGPTRMNYAKVISLVDYTARALTRALTL
jgi:heat-inducible transcriptional repressor